MELAIVAAALVWFLLRNRTAPASTSPDGSFVSGSDSQSASDLVNQVDQETGAMETSGIPLWQAIARQEGFYVDGTRANRNNNPGNLEYGSFAISQGATGSDGRFAIFPDADAGFTALKNLLANFYHGLTLRQAISKYAPASENDTNAYVNNVSQWTGIAPDSPIEGS